MNQTQLTKSSTTIVLYHKNCMDGIASAYIADQYFEFFEVSRICIPIQYGENIYEVIGEENIDQVNDLYFLDFSTDRKTLIDLASKFNKVVIIDHHKTAEAELKNIDTEKDNIELYFNMSKSGAMLSYEYFTVFTGIEPQKDLFGDIVPETDILNISRRVIEYIQDRDIWEWKLPYSKEVSEYLKFAVKPNDINSFKNMIQNFNIDNARNIGETLNQARDKAVESKVKNYREINIVGINLVCVNLTENISEVGNELCKLTGKPAMMYFIKEDLQVILSFRSLDELPDVSFLAKYFGGGGHRNACGASINMIQLINILNNYYFISPDME